ncbi:hypothetical protein CCR75_008007 [Bremia lactucae]|uniref:Uncharacterized protein n=1 Tax=Bremia lactucae TaxID=4779 RepID=A0A976IC93_BRELC|nr:hypothetical protein CCR75_008007 [Bremia lactucae]
MKRSRACNDLVALATEASAHRISTESSLRCAVDDWTPFVEGMHHRCKRSRAAVISGDEDSNEPALHEQHRLQCMVTINDVDLGSADAKLRSSSVTCLIDSLPLHRTLRENMLSRKKKQRLEEGIRCWSDLAVTDSMAIDQTTLRAKPHLTSMAGTPESRILRGLRLHRESRCINQRNKRQVQPFDMTSFIMLSISSKP